MYIEEEIIKQVVYIFSQTIESPLPSFLHSTWIQNHSHTTYTPLSHAQLTQVSETGFDPVSTRFAFTCTFVRSDNDVIRKKKMAAEDQAVVILCFALVWFWRRRAQRRSAARARDAAARRRMATFRRLQEDELALVTSIAAELGRDGHYG